MKKLVSWTKRMFALVLRIMISVMFGAVVTPATKKEKPYSKTAFSILVSAGLAEDKAKSICQSGVNMLYLNKAHGVFGYDMLTNKGLTGKQAYAVFVSYDNYVGNKNEQRKIDTYKALSCNICRDADLGYSIADELNKLNGVSFPVAKERIEEIISNIESLSKVTINRDMLFTRTYACSEASELAYHILPGQTSDALIFYEIGAVKPDVEYAAGKAGKKQKSDMDDIMLRLQTALVNSVLINGVVSTDGRNLTNYKFVSSSSGQVKELKGVLDREDMHDEAMQIMLCGLTPEQINERGGKIATKYLQLVYLCFTPSRKTEYKLRQIIVCPEDVEMKTFKDVPSIKVSDKNGYDIDEGLHNVTISMFDGQITWRLASFQGRVGAGKFMGIHLGTIDKYFTDDHPVQTCWPGYSIKWDPDWHVGIASETVMKNASLFKSPEQFYSAHEKYGRDTVRIVTEVEDKHDDKALCRQLIMSLFDMSNEEIAELCKAAMWTLNWNASTKGLVSKMTGLVDFVSENGQIKPVLDGQKQTALQMLLQSNPLLANDPAIMGDFEQSQMSQMFKILGLSLPMPGSGYKQLGRDPVAHVQIHGQGKSIYDEDIGVLRGDDVNFPGHGGSECAFNRNPSPYASWRTAMCVDVPELNNGCLCLSVFTLFTEWFQADQDGDELIYSFLKVLINVIKRMAEKYDIKVCLFDKLTPPSVAGKNPKHIPEDERDRCAWVAETLMQSFKYNLVAQYSDCATRFWNTITPESTPADIHLVYLYTAVCYAGATWAVDAMKTGYMPMLPESFMKIPGVLMNYGQRFTKHSRSMPAFDPRWDEKTLPLGNCLVDRITKYLIDKMNLREWDVAGVTGMTDAEKAHQMGNYLATLRGMLACLPAAESVPNVVERPLPEKYVRLLKEFGSMNFVYQVKVNSEDEDKLEKIRSKCKKDIKEYPAFESMLGKHHVEGDDVVYSLMDRDLADAMRKCICGEPVTAWELFQVFAIQNTSFVKNAYKESSKNIVQTGDRDRLIMTVLSLYRPENGDDCSEFEAMCSVARTILSRCFTQLKNCVYSKTGTDEPRKRQIRKLAYRLFARYMNYFMNEIKEGRMAQFVQNETTSMKGKQKISDAPIDDIDEEVIQSLINDDEANFDLGDTSSSDAECFREEDIPDDEMFCDVSDDSFSL